MNTIITLDRDIVYWESYCVQGGGLLSFDGEEEWQMENGEPEKSPEEMKQDLSQLEDEINTLKQVLEVKVVYALFCSLRKPWGAVPKLYWILRQQCWNTATCNVNNPKKVMYLTIDVFISKAIFIHEITCTRKLSTLLSTIFTIGFTLWPKGGLVIYVCILCSERIHNIMHIMFLIHNVMKTKKSFM